MDAGTWVIATWNGSAAGTNQFLYVDGIQVASSGLNHGGARNNATFGFGLQPSGVAGTSNSAFAEIRFYNHALSAAEVATLTTALIVTHISCGDGLVNPGEQCDDGNTTNGDGCDATCQIEPCWACGGEPSVCELAQATMDVDAAGSVGFYPSIAIGSDGLPVISQYDAGNDDLKVAHCNDLQCATRTTTVVANGIETAVNGAGGGGDAGEYSQIAISGDGNPIISFRQDGIMLRTAHCNEPSCTSTPLIFEVDHPGGSGTGYENSLTVLPDGHPLIAWGRPSTGSAGLWVSHCNNFACSNADGYRIDPDSGDRATAIAIGGDGLPLVAFRNSSDDLTVAHCGTANCNGSVSTQTLDADAGVGNAIAIGSDGFGIISYQDFTVNALKVVHCTNAACTAFDPPVTIDGGGTVGGYTSIAIGADGRPLIAYYESNLGDLKLARCNNATCSNGAAIRTVDGPGNVGVGLDIAMSDSGQAYIAYGDNTNENLKLAICGPRRGDGHKTPDEECDDGNLTNGDGCSASGTVETCWNCSGDPSVCTPRVSGSSCPDDGLFCSGIERCDGAGACVSTGNPCTGGPDCQNVCNETADNCLALGGAPCSDEPNPCTVDTCDGAGTCGHVPGNAGATCRASAGDCDLAELCTGLSATCPPNGFVPSGTPCGSSADTECTDPDTCNGLGTCQPNDESSGTPCSDANACTDPDACDGSGNCTAGGPLDCNDDDLCTQDSCDTGSGCVNADTPTTGCATAAKSLILIKQSGGVSEKLLWKWIKGQSADQSDFGDPTAGSDYALCVYVGTGLLFSTELPAGPPWEAVSDKGYKYKDATGANDGATNVLVKGSTDDKSRALVKGKGSNLPDPVLGNFTQAVTAQLVHEGAGVCLASVFQPGNFKKNTTEQLKAKAP